MTTALAAAVAAETSRVAKPEPPRTIPVRDDRRDTTPIRQEQQPMTTSSGITSTIESPTEALLRRAAQSESPRIRKAAERVTEALDRLREAFAEDEGKRAARERVAKLEAELAAARAALRHGATAGTRTAAAATGEAQIACQKGCGRMFRDRRGIGLHEKSCTAG